MHFNVLLGIEPKLLLMFWASIQILEMEYLDYVVKIIPAVLVSGFTLYKWVVFYKKNNKDENDY